MSQDPGSGSDETPQPLPPHPLVRRLKPDPSQPAERVTELIGLPGDSDRPGHQRLYLTARLDYYAEFQVREILHSEAVAADQSPLSGLDATRVHLRRDATISYTWTRSPQPVDEFDLDVRLGRTSAADPRLLTILPLCTAACFTALGNLCEMSRIDTQCHSCVCRVPPVEEPLAFTIQAGCTEACHTLLNTCRATVCENACRTEACHTLVPVSCPSPGCVL